MTGKAYLVQGDATHIASLALVLPAKVGPVDLGDVVTLADLTLAATTAWMSMPRRFRPA